MPGAQPRSVLVLDFDGVICDSAAETGLTGWRAARCVWPGMPIEPPNGYVDRFAAIRPVLETGYEAVLMARMLHAGIDVARILAEFPALRARFLVETDRSVEQLVELFGATRDTWLVADPEGWLSVHRFYPEIMDALGSLPTSVPVFVITTKQKRFAETLLARVGIGVPPEHVFGLESGPKAGVLHALVVRRELRGAAFHFVEDRLKTLRTILADPALTDLLLYFAEWGFVRSGDRESVAGEHRIRSLSLESFVEWIRFLRP